LIDYINIEGDTVHQTWFQKHTNSVPEMYSRSFNEGDDCNL
jgi:hypothetical protein